MKGINCLVDLRAMLEAAKIEVFNFTGWSVETLHGQWGMVLGEVYLNNHPIKTLAEAKSLAQFKKKKVVNKRTEIKNDAGIKLTRDPMSRSAGSRQFWAVGPTRKRRR